MSRPGPGVSRARPPPRPPHGQPHRQAPRRRACALTPAETEAGRPAAPPPGAACERPSKLLPHSPAAPGRQQLEKWSCGRMSAGSDPVVIVSAARTAIGKWPAAVQPRGPRNPWDAPEPAPRAFSGLPAGSPTPSSPAEAYSASRALIGSPGRTTVPPCLPIGWRR